MVNLTRLAPDIVAAILDETLPSDLTLFELAVDRRRCGRRSGGEFGWHSSVRQHVPSAQARNHKPPPKTDYDQHDQLFQFQEGHLVFAYNILAASTVPEVIYHLNSGRYFVTAAANEDRPPDNSVAFNAGYFTSDSVQKMTAK